MSYKTAIIGAGPAGCMCAYFAQDNNEVTLFEAKSPLHTLLYTGGGRCNLAHAEYDFRELAKHFPRGEKFLYSIFSRFSTGETLDFFGEIGVETYTQEDLRIFPTSDSAKDVREKVLDAIVGCAIRREKVLQIEQDTNSGNGFLIKTDKSIYNFDKVIITVGGHAGFELAKGLGHSIVAPKPALTGLVTKENLKPIQGVSLKNVCVIARFNEQHAKLAEIQACDDMIFTQEGISGPLAYKISSLCARWDYNKSNPLVIKLKFTDVDNFQELLNANSKKDIKNLLSDLVPRSIAEYVLGLNSIALETKCHAIDGKTRDLIVKSLCEFELNVVSPAKDGEVVTSGGIALDEINPKTMESKIVAGLYFAGEVIDVDGFCGGFNLQNCWSTGFVAGSSV